MLHKDIIFENRAILIQGVDWWPNEQKYAIVGKGMVGSTEILTHQELIDLHSALSEYLYKENIDEIN